MDESLGYDETPYPSAPYPYSHCDHLAMVARLCGIAAAPVEHCRVLEVGCADGANLIPMALTLGGSRFVGIDLSERQIQAGSELVSRLGLRNIELRRQDLSEFAVTEEPFDYIVAHGIYSWTSPNVQVRLLDLCRQCLAESGVAFVSYNVYPGWQSRRILREWLLRTIPAEAETGQRMQTARRLMAGLGRTLAAHGGEDQRTLTEELVRLQAWNDCYLRHDLLEDHNEPLLFADFVQRVEAHGLQFFAEADVASMAGAGLPAELYANLQRLGGSLVGREQLLDLVTNRAFRQSLLCRAECQPSRQLDGSAILSAYVVSSLRARHPSVSAGGPLRFESRSGFALDISEPLVAAALTRLEAAWPRGAKFKDLIDDVEEHRESLANVLLVGFVERAVGLHTILPAGAAAISDRPIASPLARIQAATSTLVTNLRHDVVSLEPLARQVLVQLTGDHDRASLARIVADLSGAEKEKADLDALLRYFWKASLLMA